MHGREKGMKNTDRQSSLRWLYAVLEKDRKTVLLLTVICVFEGLASTLFAVILKTVIDAGVRKDQQSFLNALVCLLAVSFFGAGMYALETYWEEKSKALLERRFRLRLFSQLLDRSYAQVAAVHSGEWMTRICSDGQVVSHSLIHVFPRLLGLVMQAISSLAALAVVLPSLLYILIPGAAALTVYSVFFRRKLKTLHKEVQQQDGITRSFMQENLSGMMVLRAFQRQKYSAEQAEIKTNQWVHTRIRRAGWMAAHTGGMQFCIQIGYMIIIALCGNYLLHDIISYGTLVSALQLARQAGALTNISGFAPQYYAMMASIERMTEIESFEMDHIAAAKPPQLIQDYYKHQFYSIGFQNAFFSYPDGKESVIEEFSAEIKKGEYTALEGVSGKGKTTILKLLLGLYPLQKGEIYLQETNGARQNLDASWRGLFAYVPQGNYLFSGTIREIITFRTAETPGSESRLWQSLAQACADEFVRDLPQGLDTELGERGAGLSEGQMQRIAIARALYSECPILMLDEATSALDPGTEERLLRNLRSMTDRTVILVSHHQTAQKICDSVVRF